MIDVLTVCEVFFMQAEDGIRDLVRSRGLGDVYKRQIPYHPRKAGRCWRAFALVGGRGVAVLGRFPAGAALPAQATRPPVGSGRG